MFVEIVEFLKLVGRLKRIERTGWVTKVGIERPESVADHIFRTSILSMIVADMKKMNTEKILKMSLLHDLPEALMGDWDKFAKRKLGEKKFEERETFSIEKILLKLPKDLRESYLSLWKELKEGKSDAAKLVKQIDKLETALQALEYGEEGYDKNKLNEFFESAKLIVEDSVLKKFLEILEKGEG